MDFRFSEFLVMQVSLYFFNLKKFKLIFLIKGFSGDNLYFDKINCIIEPTVEQGGLYLGNLDAASDLKLLKKYKIGAVLTVAAGSGLNYPE